MAAKPGKKASDNETELAAKVQRLARQVEELQRKVKLSEASPQPEKRFPKLPAWVMLREYLISVGGTSQDTAIVKALLAAGHSLGKYPLRTIMNTARSPRLSGMFTVHDRAEGQYITVSPSYFYKSPYERGAAANKPVAKPSLVKSAPADNR